jgi:hypothetical protein
MSAPAILAALQKENSARCIPPMDAGDVVTIAESVARYAPDPEAVRALAKGDSGKPVEFQRLTAAELDAGDYTLE